jgi:ATP-binding cassette, subfamily B, bacterial
MRLFAWRYLAPQRPLLLGMALLLPFSIGLQVVGPQVVARFLDGAGAGAPLGSLLGLALWFLVVSAAAPALKVLAAYGSDRVAWAAGDALRLDVTAHLLRLDAPFHGAHAPGELLERVDGDVGLLAASFSALVVEVVGSLLLFAGTVGAVLWVDVRLGVVFMLVALVALAVMSRVRRLTTPWVRQERGQAALFYGTVGEVLTATEELRANGAAGYALAQVGGHLQRWQGTAVRAGMRASLVGLTAFAAFALLDGAAYGLGGWLHLGGALSGGTLYLVVTYAAQLAQPLEQFRRQLEQLQRAEAAFGRIRELLAVTSAIADGDTDLPTGAPVGGAGGRGALSVAFESVSFQYGEEAVLRGLSFRLAPGQVLGIVGRTGSGKSTMARLLFRLYDPQAGRIALNGIDLRRLRLASLRSRVAWVTQEVQLFAGATVRENLTLFDPTPPDTQVADALDQVGLGPWLRALPHGLQTPVAPGALSAGQAQLLALARVFLQDPGLVILDEASSRLDPETEAQLEQAVQRLLAGRTAVIIAHRPAWLMRADMIIRLDDGQATRISEEVAVR